MEEVKMLGALVGDIIGLVYEFCNTKSMDFELFCGGNRCVFYNQITKNNHE